jgi:hypothetical protein
MINDMNDAWVKFKETMIPEDASMIQLESMEFAFYCGAFSMFTLMDAVMTSGAPAEEMAARFEKLMQDVMDWKDYASLRFGQEDTRGH